MLYECKPNGMDFHTKKGMEKEVLGLDLHVLSQYLLSQDLRSWFSVGQRVTNQRTTCFNVTYFADRYSLCH